MRRGILQKFLVFSILSAICDLGVGIAALNRAIPFTVVLAAAAAACAAAAAFFFGFRNRKLEREAEAQRRRAEEQNRICEEVRETTHKQVREQMIRFHSTVSHSLRIPISVIEGYAELLLGDLISDEEVRRGYLRKICERTTYMNNVLGQLLLEARLQSELPAAYFQQIDLLELARKVSTDMSSSAQKLGIRIDVTSSQNCVMISGDSIQLTKAFYNIIENSLKYMGREGVIKIVVSLVEDRAFVAFRDNGNGMDETEAGHVFEAHYQGSNKVSGSGLGLNMVDLTVRAHGGTVEAKSSPGHGMGIFITLPVHHAGETASGSANHSNL